MAALSSRQTNSPSSGAALKSVPPQQQHARNPTTTADPLRYVTDLFRTATPALCSGAVQAVLFNPYDRALYVRVQHKRRRFLDKRNFESPFQGFANAAVYRTISSASYIFWQDTCRYLINDIGGGEGVNTFTRDNYPILYSAVTGIFAGAANGLALNNMQAVKFTMWSQSSQVVNHWETKKDAKIIKQQLQQKQQQLNGGAAGGGKFEAAKGYAKGVGSSTSSTPMTTAALGAKGGEGSSAFAKNIAKAATASTATPPTGAAGASGAAANASKGFFATAHEMYQLGGPRVFFRGVKVTILRDTIFGLVYELLRNSKNLRMVIESGEGGVRHVSRRVVSAAAKGRALITGVAPASTTSSGSGHHHATAAASKAAAARKFKHDQNAHAFIQNVFAACCGCIASSPINYLRSLSYGTPLGAEVLPIGTLFRFHLREVRYVLNSGHTFTDAMRGRPQQGLEVSEINRVEATRQRLGFTSLYSSGDGKAYAEEATQSYVHSFKRWLSPARTKAEATADVRAGRRYYWAAAVHMNRRLNAGWGSLRVGLGMAVGQHIFALVKEAMDVR